jgi:hypothetical protein
LADGADGHGRHPHLEAPVDLCRAVKAEAETKMAAGGVDVDAVKRQAERPPGR